MTCKRISAFLSVLAGVALAASAIDHPGITIPSTDASRFTLISGGQPVRLLVDPADNVGVRIAASNLSKDFERVCGVAAPVDSVAAGERIVIVGSPESKYIKQLIKNRTLDKADLEGMTEKYVMTTVSNPFEGVDEALVIAGSDRRGAIYGIYELSEQIGVSPWYDWADVAVKPQSDLSIERGTYTAGEPAVRYRGIFLNDEAPCLTGWVNHTYGTDYGDHRFYARMFELILRLRGNFLWPAMWGWSFYADDPLNSSTANDMGVIMGTSHHEPMARNHQEWARHRKEYGAWDYATNSEVLDRFFREGIERAASTEDLITIGMRGDGDAPMGDENGNVDDYNMNLLRTIIKNQRRIIRDVTGKKPEKTPQVWAIYKEVQKYYDLGLRVPDDVIMLVCDDNWGNVRKLPDAQERRHPGGWGMYYHVDYVGAPRNTKWLNVTPVQNLWEQMRLTYDYGVDKLWILNVGDLKPMEYPITLFLDMAWNPTKYDASTLTGHTRAFCAQQFGEEEADEAARILNLQCKYAGRITAEMLDRNTYSLESGEWKQVADEYTALEADALRQYVGLPQESRDAYSELILFPVQAMANLYRMYYAQAMNHALHAGNNPEANRWADEVERCFRRDSLLCDAYNNTLAGGKWKNMMTQKHIGYSSWNDNFPKDMMPECRRVADVGTPGGYHFTEADGIVAIEAEHFNSSSAPVGTEWTVIPHMGRTLSGVALMPYRAPVDSAALRYTMTLTGEPRDSVDVHVILKSTLAFSHPEGHRFAIGFDGAEETIVNYNGNLNEEPENIYSVFYPTVARRVVDSKISLPLPAASADGTRTLTLRPLDPAVVFEKIVVDCGGYRPSYLFSPESPHRRQPSPTK